MNKDDAHEAVECAYRLAAKEGKEVIWVKFDMRKIGAKTPWNTKVVKDGKV
jgi:hypothetical protein